MIKVNAEPFLRAEMKVVSKARHVGSFAESGNDQNS